MDAERGDAGAGVPYDRLGDRLGAPWTVALNAAVALSYGIYVALRYPRVRNLT